MNPGKWTRCASAVALWAISCPVMAQNWVPMTGADIHASLTDRTVRYGAARQKFHASGRTLYDGGRPARGYWRVEGDSYCSQWPPGDLWACYTMDRADPDLIRFVAGDGSVTEGQMSGD